MRGPDRRSRVLAAFGVAALAAAVSACGDPLLILGDWPGYMRVVLGVPGSPGFRVDSIATNTQLSEARGVVAARDGSVYVGDAHGRIFKVEADGRAQLILNPANWTTARPDQVQGMALDSAGILYVADPGSNRIWRLPGRGEPIAGNGQDHSDPDGPALSTAILAPHGVVLDGSGRVYFSERSGYRVRRIEPDGSLRTIAGTGVAGYSGDGGPATAAQLNGPAGLALSGSTLYIADAGNARVRAVDLGSGVIRTVAGSGAAGFGGDGGPASAVLLNDPEALAVTGDGRSLYVVDRLNQRVRRVDLAAGTISTFAGTGSTEFSGSGRSAAETALNMPSDVAFSPYQLLFVLDAGHAVLWRTPLGL